MSIVTLKRKTNALYKNSSVGMKQFSVEGTRRNKGYVGQDTLGRTILKTPFRGNTPRGAGGCCGDYKTSILVPYGTHTVEDTTIVKSSTLSNYGYLATRFRWIRRPAPFSTVKIDNNSKLNTAQSSFIERLRRNVVDSIDVYNETHSTVPPLRVLPKLPFVVPCPPITKSVGPLTYSQYLLQVNQACTANDAPVARPVSSTPLPG